MFRVGSRARRSEVGLASSRETLVPLTIGAHQGSRLQLLTTELQRRPGSVTPPQGRLNGSATLSLLCVLYREKPPVSTQGFARTRISHNTGATKFGFHGWGVFLSWGRGKARAPPLGRMTTGAWRLWFPPKRCTMGSHAPNTNRVP